MLKARNEILICYYRLLVVKNHVGWWMYDNVAVGIFRLTGWMDGSYWSLYLRMRRFV